jgi:hypothetical protein
MRLKNIFMIGASVFSLSVNAQDSTKAINHEIGFNTVSLIKQLVSNNPTSSLPQLPYSIFYNLYFKDRLGIRTGLGLNTRNETVEIEGQKDPRITKGMDLDLRLGVSNNFLKRNRLTLNAFADLLYSSSGAETVNTHTVQNFGDPVQEIHTTTSDSQSGMGAQVGVGVKYDIVRNLAIYLEVPLSYMSETLNTNVVIKEIGLPDNKSNTKFTNTRTTLFLPTTVYLVLRF